MEARWWQDRRFIATSAVYLGLIATALAARSSPGEETTTLELIRPPDAAVSYEEDFDISDIGIEGTEATPLPATTTLPSTENEATTPDTTPPQFPNVMDRILDEAARLMAPEDKQVDETDSHTTHPISPSPSEVNTDPAPNDQVIAATTPPSIEAPLQTEVIQPHEPSSSLATEPAPTPASLADTPRSPELLEPSDNELDTKQEETKKPDTAPLSPTRNSDKDTDASKEIPDPKRQNVLWIGTGDEGDDWKERWGLVGEGQGQNIDIVKPKHPRNGNAIRIYHPGPGHPNAGDGRWGYGGRFSFKELGIPPQEATTLEYYVWIPDNLERQGKLPGLQGHRGDIWAPSNNKRGELGYDDMSTRTMWKAVDGDPDRIGMITYLNVPWANGKQKPETHSVSIRYVDQNGNPLLFKKGAWNHVKQTVMLNNPGKKNGVFEGWINGVKGVSLDDVLFRYTDELQLNQWELGVFWGGPREDFPKEPTELLFDDVALIGIDPSEQTSVPDRKSKEPLSKILWAYGFDDESTWEEHWGVEKRPSCAYKNDECLDDVFKIVPAPEGSDMEGKVAQFTIHGEKPHESRNGASGIFWLPDMGVKPREELAASVDILIPEDTVIGDHGGKIGVGLVSQANPEDKDTSGGGEYNQDSQHIRLLFHRLKDGQIGLKLYNYGWFANGTYMTKEDAKNYGNHKNPTFGSGKGHHRDRGDRYIGMAPLLVDIDGDGKSPLTLEVGKKNTIEIRAKMNTFSDRINPKTGKKEPHYNGVIEVFVNGKRGIFIDDAVHRSPEHADALWNGFSWNAFAGGPFGGTHGTILMDNVTVMAK